MPLVSGESGKVTNTCLVFDASGARVARYDFPANLSSSIPVDPIITTVPTNDGQGRAYGLEVFVSRPSAPNDARLTGWASYTWGRAAREAYGRQVSEMNKSEAQSRARLSKPIVTP